MDLSHLFGSDRKLTTLIATKLRNLRLEDGSFADEVRLASRHGAGDCWGFWMRRTDDDLDHELVTSDVGTPISAEDPDLLDVTSRFSIRVN